MSLPTPAIVTSEARWHCNHLGEGTCMDCVKAAILADRRRVKDACAEAVADAGGDNTAYHLEAISALDIGEPAKEKAR